MNGLAKVLMVAGAAIFLAGCAVLAIEKLGLPFGRLPGDISYEGKNFKVFAPITSMIVASVVLTIIVNLIARFGGKR